jgi:hypothetical protein
MRLSIWLNVLVVSLMMPFASSAETTATYTWMLPRTVLDVSLVYSYAKCTERDKFRVLKFNITPTISARGIPDRLLKLRREKTSDLDSAWEDRNISISTFEGSHVLKSAGASPANQTATIVGNILGGITKLVAVGLGVPPVGVSENSSPPPDCTDDLLAQVKKYKSDIHDLQVELSSGPTEDLQKKFAVQIAAKQALMADLTASMALTVKATIDPGYTDVKVELDPEAKIKALPDKPEPIKGELIASFLPPLDKIGKLAGLEALSEIERDKLTKALTVNVYLDFANALPKIQPLTAGINQTEIGGQVGNVTYREPALIPVLVWQGNKDADPKKESVMPLSQPVSFPFAQFGFEQVLPLTAPAFKNLSWAVTFTELGEVTSATYTSKSWLAGATQMFSGAASASSGIASELRSASQLTSPSTEAAALQSQGDVIYETKRLALCRADSSSCPSK